MTVMLRLDPALLPLWRDPTTLQLGIEAAVVLEGVAPWQERLLFELGRGFPECGIDVWCDLQRVHTREARRFLDRLGALVRRSDAGAPPPAPRRIAVDAPDGAARSALVETVLVALRADGAEAGLWVPNADDRPDAVVLVSHHVTDPARARAHLRADRVHLPVVASARTVGIGPLVVPGESACTTCIDLARRDQDDAWPRLAAQLNAAPTPRTPAELVHGAAAAVLRALNGTAAPGASVRLRAGDETPIVREHPRHAMCGCRAPQGTGTAPALPARRSAPTTARPRAVPA